jgi:hypothetical protein
MKATDIRRQDDENDSASQKTIARARTIRVRLMRVLIALTILPWAGVLVALFAPMPL